MLAEDRCGLTGKTCQTSPVRVVGDATCWTNRRGFGRFTRELLGAMARRSGEHELVLLIDESSAGRACLPPGIRVETVATDAAPAEQAAAHSSRSLRDLRRFRAAAARLRPGAFFFPAVYSYFPVAAGPRAVVVLHDAIAENRPADIFPNRRSRWLWNLKVRMALRRANCIATVSEYSRGQVAATFGLDPASVAVLGEGVGDEFVPDQDAGTTARALGRAGLAPGDRYLLYVGGVSPHKNLEGLVAALAALYGRGKAVPLVICGEVERDPFHSAAPDLMRLVGDLGLTEFVRFSGFVPDEELPALYAKASVVALPSFDEGFCLPAAEAMACGAPVAASRAGALPETLGPAGAYFDPHDVVSIADALESLLQDSDLRARLRAAGLERAAGYRWDAVAQRTWRVLTEGPLDPPRDS